jgi:glycosyltransferase involved in cell wall biosynthesis
MPHAFQELSVSIILIRPKDISYEPRGLEASVRSALEQDHPNCEVILADGRGDAAKVPDGIDSDDNGKEGVKLVSGSFASRAQMLSAAIEQATGQYLLLVLCDAAPVLLKRSAVSTLVLSAIRHPHAGMFYADYSLVEGERDGESTSERHLLDWHQGRLRDNTDLGRVWLLPADLLKQVGGFDPSYQAADLYDLRLRLGAAGPLIHIANRYAGSLYTVHAGGSKHNVFDYLLSDKAGQLEMERALGEHLKRIGAYLEPGAHMQQVAAATEPESPAAGAASGACIASIVIPVNNRPEFIGRAIESVLRQTVKTVEAIVVVNGGPEDPTIPAVREYLEGGAKHDPTAPPVRLIVVDINNLGLCLNMGIAAARGKYYVQLDSDDRLKPDAVAKLRAVFDSDPTIGMVIGSYEVWDLDAESGAITQNQQIPVVTHDEWTDQNGRNNLLRINGAGAPRSAHIQAIADVGWFGVNDDPSCRNYGEDYDLVLRMSERYRIGRVWDPIYEVIRHAGGTDHSINQAVVDRNDNAKDHMRLNALRRRQAL